MGFKVGVPRGRTEGETLPHGEREILFTLTILFRLSVKGVEDGAVLIVFENDSPALAVPNQGAVGGL